MSEEQTPPPPRWAVIELMGHAKTAGLVSKDTEYGTPLLRVDVPGSDGMMTQYVNPQSIYRMTVCSEAIARAVAGNVNSKPVSTWELRQLPAAESDQGEELPELPQTEGEVIRVDCEWICPQCGVMETDELSRDEHECQKD